MKLLFDENLSHRLVDLLSETFPNSLHVDLVGMKGFTDTEIWNYAIQEDAIIVSKDNDFRQKSFYFGSPPKVIWLSIGNAKTSVIADLITANYAIIRTFVADTRAGLLVI